MKVVNLTRNVILANEVRVADTFFARLKGLLGTACLPAGQGLIIQPCDSVHTFGMKYDIDVVFVDERQLVVKTVADMRPGRVAMGRAGKYVLELPAGTLANTCTAVGDCLSSCE